MKANVCFLQKTHFKASLIPRFWDKNFPLVYNSCSPDNKTKGVSILINHNVPWSTTNTWSDEDGRLLFVKGLIKMPPYTLASIYAPNSAQITFIENVLDQLQDFAERGRGSGR